MADFGRVGGKRFRIHRKSLEEITKAVKEKKAELKDFGRSARTMSESQRVQAVESFRKLDRIGVSLTDAVNDYVKRHPLGGMSRTLEQVIEEMVSKKREGNRRKRYVDAMQWQLDKFARRYPARGITSISTVDVEKYIASFPHWKPRSISGLVQMLKVLFYYGIKRGYCTENPCLRIEVPKPEDKEVVIASVEIVRKIMVAAKGAGGEFDNDFTPYVAVGFFSGIRPDEIEKLQWEQVDFENKTITVLSGSAKGRARRIVDMSENLMAWIRPYYDKANRTGPVSEVSSRVTRIHLRTALGYPKWPHNIMRHSFASYHYAFHRNEQLLMQLMGHGDDGRILHNHYRALVQPNAAKEFWNIFP